MTDKKDPEATVTYREFHIPGFGRLQAPDTETVESLRAALMAEEASEQDSV